MVFVAVALEGRFSRKDKLRYYYILGQLYQETNQTMLASETFNKLVRMRPHYRMAFYARIQRAEMGVTEENFASQRIIEKIGLTFLTKMRFTGNETEFLLYEVNLETYENWL